MLTEAAARPMEQALRGAPLHIGNLHQHEAKVRRLCRQMDSLGRFNQDTGEVYIDEPSFRRVLRDYFPVHMSEPLLSHLKSLPGNRFVDESD